MAVTEGPGGSRSTPLVTRGCSGVVGGVQFLSPAWSNIGPTATQLLSGFTVALPPTEETPCIAAALQSDLAATAGTISRAEREITLLREYHTRLIADAVTGKLDVRQVAASLPDEADEPEALDDALAETDEDAADGDLETALKEAEV